MSEETAAWLTRAAYEAAADDEAHGLLAERLSLAFGAVTTWTLELARDGTVTIGSAWQMAEHIAPYEEYYFKHDLWRQRSVLCRLNVATNCERLVSQDEMARSEIFNDFIVPSGNEVFHCLGVMLTTPTGDMTGVGIQRQRSQAAFDEEDEGLLQAIQPHLSRMAAARWRVRDLGDRLSAAELQLSRDPDAVFILDRQGRILWCNAAARTPAPDTPVGSGPTGRLACRRNRDANRLAVAIADATCSFPAGQTFSLECLEGTDRWWLAVDPGQKSGRPTAIVRLTDRDGRARRQSRAAMAAFGLSPTECILAEALLRGSTLESYALKRGVSITTARAQLRSILLRSGTDRQASFVAMASSLPT